jgi:hypothetical protein
VLLAAVLFQSHWVDDLGGVDDDTAGIVVSAIGTIALAAGYAKRASLLGRVVLAAALGFVIFVSAADLAGVAPDGSLAEDVVSHWQAGLGWPLTLVVFVTLMSAVLALVRVVRGRIEWG